LDQGVCSVVVPRSCGDPGDLSESRVKSISLQTHIGAKRIPLALFVACSNLGCPAGVGQEGTTLTSGTSVVSLVSSNFSLSERTGLRLVDGFHDAAHEFELLKLVRDDVDRAGQNLVPNTFDHSSGATEAVSPIRTFVKGF
jgi:hypothetical protein